MKLSIIIVSRNVKADLAESLDSIKNRPHGLHPENPVYDLDGLVLGRIATKDFACCRVLDRMLM